MAKCPKCATPDAYIGFNSIECRNPDCEHFVLQEKKECGCCGRDHDTAGCPDANSFGDDSGGNGPPANYSAGDGGEDISSADFLAGDSP